MLAKSGRLRHERHCGLAKDGERSEEIELWIEKLLGIQAGMNHCATRLRVKSGNATSSNGLLLIVYADALEGLGLRIVGEMDGGHFAVSGNNDGRFCGDFPGFLAG